MYATGRLRLVRARWGGKINGTSRVSERYRGMYLNGTRRVLKRYLNSTGTVVPLPLPYLCRTFVHFFLTHTVCAYNESSCICFFLSVEKSDYDRLSNNVTLSDTTTEQCVSLDIVDDSVLEDIESLTVSLSLPVKQDSVSLSPPTATVFITDDDSEK